MIWKEEWRSIAARVEAFAQTSATFALTHPPGSGDSYAIAAKFLLPEAREIGDCIKKFSCRNDGNLPQPFLALMEKHKGALEFSDVLSSSHDSSRQAVVAAGTLFSTLKAVLEYSLTDYSAIARRRTDRAFEHLQRLIEVDANLGTLWKNAFAKGETDCERLGATHLLHHGIWAFKARSPGEETDLIATDLFSGQPLKDANEARHAAEAMVLTEWKLIKEAAKMQAIALQGKNQAKRYSSGTLGGMALDTYRYVVLVSEDRLQFMPEEQNEGDVTYLYVNLAVSSRTPSGKKRTSTQAMNREI